MDSALSTVPSADDAAAAAVVRRRCAFRRRVHFVLACIAALIAIRTVWGIIASHRLQAEIDSIRAAGEPLNVGNFNLPESAPDDQNAVVAWRQAATATTQPATKTLTYDEATRYFHACREYPEDLRIIVQANASALQFIRQARSRPRVDLRLHFTRPMLNVMLPMMWAQRGLAKVARLSVTHHHLAGDDAESLEALADMHDIAWRLADPRQWTQITSLVALAIDSLAVDAIEEIAPTLVVEGTRISGGPALTPASRAQVVDLIHHLLDDAVLRSAWRRAFDFERAAQIDTVRWICENSSGWSSVSGSPGLPAPLDYVLLKAAQPMLESDVVLISKHLAQVREAGSAADVTAAQAMMPKLKAQTGDIESLAHLWSSLTLPSTSNLPSIYYRDLAMRHLAAAALAIRLYELDHGRRPVELSELVPDYLPAVPLDSLASGGRSIGYKPQAMPPVVYSVGNDGVDDGGQFVQTAVGFVDRKLKDLVFFLNGDRPQPKPKLSRTVQPGS